MRQLPAPLWGGSLGQMLELATHIHTPPTFMDLATCPEGQPVYPDIVQRGTRRGSALPTANTAGSSPAPLCKWPTLAGLGPGCRGNLSPRSKPCHKCGGTKTWEAAEPGFECQGPEMHCTA